MATQILSIGAVARAAHISVDAVRYYERAGLIPRAPRRSSGYRTFSRPIVERIRLVKSLQRAGFSLADIRSLMQSIDDGERDWTAIRPNLTIVLDRIETRMADLAKIQRRLRKMLRLCDEGRCPFLKAASDDRD